MRNRVADKDIYYLNIAESVLGKSTCLRRNYGAVIVNNDEIISTGYNGSPRGELNCTDIGVCERIRLNIPKGERYEICRAVHAEQNAIISASRDKMIGGTIYIVGKEYGSDKLADSTPCAICRRMIVNAGITRCVGYTNGEITDIELRENVVVEKFKLFNEDTRRNTIVVIERYYENKKGYRYRLKDEKGNLLSNIISYKVIGNKLVEIESESNGNTVHVLYDIENNNMWHIEGCKDIVVDAENFEIIHIVYKNESDKVEFKTIYRNVLEDTSIYNLNVLCDKDNWVQGNLDKYKISTNIKRTEGELVFSSIISL